jgi:hypothetical protein
MEVDFKKKIETIFIPAIEKMIIAETKHLAFLNQYDSAAALKFSEESRRTISHLKKSLIEYENYIKP